MDKHPGARKIANPRITLMIRLYGGMDVNGNGRRCFIALNRKDGLIGAWQGGDLSDVPTRLRGLARDAVTLNVTPAEIRETLRIGRALLARKGR